MAYTDPALVTEIIVDSQAPLSGQTVSGYGGKIPTRYRIRYDGRMRRVYMMQYGNAGSAYIIVRGKDTFLDTTTEHDIYCDHSACADAPDKTGGSTMHLHAGHNMIGYLPESEPLCCDDWEDAKHYMIGELLWQADQTDDGEKAMELSSAAENLNLHDGPEFRIIVGNISYWINLSDDDCEDMDR